MIHRILPIFALLTISLLACSDEEAPKTTVATQKQVETVIAEKVTFNESIFATGRLSSEEEIKLSFKTGGVIKAINVQEGQRVRAGQILASLDLDEIRAQVQQADLGVTQSSIQIDNANIALERAERDLKNVQGLYADSVATLEQLEDAQFAVRNAKNQLEAAQKGKNYSEQNKEVADFNLRYSKIVAPGSGTILRKLASPNELVGPGTPVLLFGTNDKAMVIKVNITDKDIIHVRLGDDATVEFDAYPKLKFDGTVTEIASMADPYTGTYEVEIQVDPKGKELLSGFIGSVYIHAKEQRELVSIPVDALVTGDGERVEIFVAENGRAMQTQVEVFRMEGDNMLISHGLEAGQEVIVKGAGYLQNEDSVLITQR